MCRVPAPNGISAGRPAGKHCGGPGVDDGALGSDGGRKGGGGRRMIKRDLEKGEQNGEGRLMEGEGEGGVECDARFPGGHLRGWWCHYTQRRTVWGANFVNLVFCVQSDSTRIRETVGCLHLELRKRGAGWRWERQRCCQWVPSPQGSTTPSPCTSPHPPILANPLCHLLLYPPGRWNGR